MLDTSNSFERRPHQHQGPSRYHMSSFASQLNAGSRTQRKVETLEFETWLFSNFRMWQRIFHSEVARDSSRSAQTMPWKTALRRFQKIEDNMNQDFRKSRLSKEDLGSERDTPLEPVTGTNLHVTRPAHQPSTVDQKCRGVCDKNW